MSIILTIALLNSGPLTASLGDGNTLYLSFVSDAPQKRAWRPDGTLTSPFLSNSEPHGAAGLITSLKDGDLEALLTLQVKQKPSDVVGRDGSRYLWQPTFAQLDPSYVGKYGMTTNAIRAGKDIYLCERILRKPSAGKAFSLTVKVADTQWNTVGKANFRKEVKVRGDDFVSEPAFVPGVPHALGKAFPFRIPAQWKNSDVQLICFDYVGNFYPSGGEMRTKDGREFMWFVAPIKDIARVELQARPFKSVVFKGIQPQPRA